MVQEEEARIATEEINVLIDSMAARVTEVLSPRGKSTFLVLKQRRSSSERGGGNDFRNMGLYKKEFQF
jgi:hypothetical protein